jgi:hypothetical protein
MDEWRRNGTCSACAHFEVDFGEAPDLHGHCKMYPRTGSRQAGDATCHAFSPEAGFAERVQIAARTTVPDSSRQRTAPGRVLFGASGEAEPTEPSSAATVRRRDGAVLSPSSGAVAEPEPKAGSAGPAAEAMAPVPPDPTAQADGDWSEAVALREVLERFGLLAPVDLAEEAAGATLLIQPADTALKPAELEVDVLFRKLSSVRDRLRLVEQKVNAHPRLGEAARLELQHPVTRAYGAISSFSALFRPESATWHARRGARRTLEALLRPWDTFRPFEIAPKWQGGTTVVRAADGTSGLRFPNELLFEKAGRLRDALERLSAAIAAHPGLDRDDRDNLEDYVAKSNGSLTTLNILFRHAEDRFSSK